MSKNSHADKIKKKFDALSTRARLAIAMFIGENANSIEKSSATFFPKYFLMK
jgi:hypothetical protein